MQSKFWRSASLAVVAVFAVGMSSPAWAGPKEAAASAAVPSPEARALGLQMAHDIFEVQDLPAIFAQTMGKGPLAGIGQYEPAWPGLMIEATNEEVQAQRPRLEAAFGDVLAGYFTIEELRIGVKILGDPGMQAYIRELWAGRSTDGLYEKIPAEIARLDDSPMGRQFHDRFQGIGAVMGPFTTQFLDIVIPGVYRRLAVKLEAEVASRRGTAQP